MQIECLKEEIFDNAREKKKLVDPFNQNILKADPTRVKSEKELEKEKRKKRGFEIVENGTEMPNFIVRMRNRQCYALMLALLKKGQDRVEVRFWQLLDDFDKFGSSRKTEKLWSQKGPAQAGCGRLRLRWSCITSITSKWLQSRSRWTQETLSQPSAVAFSTSTAC